MVRANATTALSFVRYIRVYSNVFCQGFLSVIVIGLTLICLSTNALADLEEDPVASSEEVGDVTGFFIEYFGYEDYVYSRSKKTELGDNVQMDLGLRYQYSPDTFGRIRFKTDPTENRLDNKTSNFEFLVGHRRGAFYFQIDSELDTNEDDTGGTTFGLDLDSELTHITYSFNDSLSLTFYPFNFDGEVGNEFNTYDVTRLYFVEGAPSLIRENPTENEKLAEKTIPGFVLNWNNQSGFKMYAGFGAASYLYPSDVDFDIEFSQTATQWERREDLGYRVGVEYRRDQNPLRYRTTFDYVAHTKADETGSLLAAAGSIYAIGQLSSSIFEVELTYSKAGDKPYRFSKKTRWFDDTSPFQPIYRDDLGDLHDWVGKSDTAVSLRYGIEIKPDVVPYVSYKYQGKNFIFRERESAHRLRTNDESDSHGGLNRYGFGAFIYEGDFVINPEVEWLVAKNEVFTNASDISNEEINATFKKTDVLFFLTISYKFGGSQLFRP